MLKELRNNSSICAFIRSTQKKLMRSILGRTHPPSKFMDPFCSFLCSAADEPTNLQTETGENITSVAKVKKKNIPIWIKR